MSLPSDLQAWFREDRKQEGEKPPNPLHLDSTFPVSFPCLLSMCEGICPACSGAPASWLPSHACPFPGWCNPATFRQLWWPPHGGAPIMCMWPAVPSSMLCICTCACSLLGEGLEGHLSTPRASLLALCTGGGCLWGQCHSCRQGAGCLDCPGGQPAQALAEAALLAHSICDQVLLASG